MITSAFSLQQAARRIDGYMPLDSSLPHLYWVMDGSRSGEKYSELDIGGRETCLHTFVLYNLPNYEPCTFI